MDKPDQLGLRWTAAPRHTQWGAGMMCALLPLGNDHTLRLYAEVEALHLVGPALDSWVFRRKVPSYSTPSEWGPVYDQTAIDTAVALAEDRYSDLMTAVEWMLADGGNMTQEHLARIRAAWERA